MLESSRSVGSRGIQPTTQGPFVTPLTRGLRLNQYRVELCERGRRRGNGLGERRRGEERTSDKSEGSSKVHFYTLCTIRQTSRASLRLVSFQCEGASRTKERQEDHRHRTQEMNEKE